MPVSQIDTHNNNLYYSARGRSNFYAAGRYWQFYRERVAAETTCRLLKHRSRVDPAGAWGDEFTVWDAGSRLMFGLWFDGTYVLLTYSKNNVFGTPIYFVRGLPNADGTITWDPVRTVNAGVGRAWYSSITICRENGPDQHIWICVAEYGSPKYFFQTWESSSTDGSGAWTERLADSPAGTSFCWCAQCVPLENTGQVYFWWKPRTGTGTANDYIRGILWNGAAFVADGDIVPKPSRCTMAASRGNEVYITYEKSPYTAVYGKKRSSAGVWSAEVLISNVAVRASQTDLAWEVESNTLYCYYEKPTGNDICRKEADGSLASPLWGNETILWDRSTTIYYVKCFGWCQDAAGYPDYCQFMVAWIENPALWEAYESPDDETVICPCTPEPPPPPPPPPPVEEGVVWSHRSPIEEANRRRRRYWRKGRAGRR